MAPGSHFAALDRNLEALQRATSEVRTEFIGQMKASGGDTVKRFFHLLLMECAERMGPLEFQRSIEVAREQLRRPL